MDNIIQLIGVDDSRIAVDSRCIFAICEMGEEEQRNEQGVIINKFPRHVAVFTDKNLFRIKDNYNEVLNQVYEINRKDKLGF